jgi:4-hydroxybenzoate polyprenyltransferase
VRSEAAVPFPTLSWRFWRAYGVTLRPYLLFVSEASGLVGLALTYTLRGMGLFASAVAFFLCYGLGQAITDTFQTDTDALSSPYRPLVRGEVTRNQVLAVSLGALALIALFFVFLNPWTIVPAAAAVIGLVLYTPLKRRWWGGPPWNSWIVAMLPLIGILLGGGALGDALTRTDAWLAMGSIYFSYAVFVLLGYFKDVEADRATGYDTLVVHFGRPVSVWVSAVHAVLALVCSVLLMAVARGSTALEGAAVVVGSLLWVTGALASLIAHWRIAKTTRDDEAYPAIALVVAGYVALHLGEATLLRPEFALAASVLFPLSVVALVLRPEKTQV